MKKFIVLYLVPRAVIGDWSKTGPEKPESHDVTAKAFQTHPHLQFRNHP